MKILYICHRFPFPPRRGGKIRPFNMIKHLSQNHEVYVASLVRSAEEAEEGKGLKQHCKHFVFAKVSEPWQTIRMILKLLTLIPSSMSYFFSFYLKKEIDKLISKEQFDLIFVHCSSVAQYVNKIKDIPKILDFGDMDSQKWLIYAKFKKFPLNFGYWLEGIKMLRVEQKLACQFELCTFTTKAELDIMNSYQSNVPTNWFPNGVDHNYFSPSDIEYEKNTISFIGRMDYFPNQECMFFFCEEILPLITEEVPNVNVIIVGANPSKKVKRLAELPGVTVTGSVKEVHPYIRRSALMIAPLNIARGTQNKILEAMAMGVPVVCSELAATGVDAIPGEHLLTAKTPEQYKCAVVKILRNPEERERLAKAGRQRILSHHNWENSMARLDQIIEDCVSKYKGNSSIRRHANKN